MAAVQYTKYKLDHRSRSVNQRNTIVPKQTKKTKIKILYILLWFNARMIELWFWRTNLFNHFNKTMFVPYLKLNHIKYGLKVLIGEHLMVLWLFHYEIGCIVILFPIWWYTNVRLWLKYQNIPLFLIWKYWNCDSPGLG